MASNNDWAAYQAGVYAAAASGDYDRADISAGYYGDVGSTAYYQGEAAVMDTLAALGYQSGDAIFEAWAEAEGLISQDATLVEDLLELIKELVGKGLASSRLWIESSLLGSESFLLRGLGSITMALLDGLEWVGALVYKALNAIAEVIDTAVNAIAKVMGDVFEVILQHIVDYAGEKSTGFVANALGIEVE